jgi:type IV pilus assembly protein PilY1
MIRKYLLVLSCLIHLGPMVRADDIDAYPSQGDFSPVYVHVLMDIGDSEVDSALCVIGADCEPPFMSETAYKHLRLLHSSGEAVTGPSVFRAVLAAVLENPQLNNIQVALQISNHQSNVNGGDSGDSSSAGGSTFLHGYRSLGDSRAELLQTLRALPILGGDQSHRLQRKESYLEWLRYIRGAEVALGSNTSGNFSQPLPIPDFDPSIIDQGSYLSPLTSGQECPSLYSVLFSQGSLLPESDAYDSDLDAEIAQETPLGDAVSFERMFASLHDPFLDLVPDHEASIALSRSWVVTSEAGSGDAVAVAAAGGGSLLYVDSPQLLEQQLTEGFAQITSTGSQISAGAFTADTFIPGRALNSVFFSLFQAQGNNRWPGNVKKLQLEKVVPGPSSGGEGEALRGQLVDAQGRYAFDNSTDNGNLHFDAVSFWTDVASLSPGDGTSLPIAADGPVVARGGAGQKIDGLVSYHQGGSSTQYFVGDSNSDDEMSGYSSRQIFFEVGGGSGLAPFNADAVTVQALRLLLDPGGVLDEDQLVDLIRWGRGQNVAGGTATVRDWLLGEVLHSKPYALNYGAVGGYSKTNPMLRIMFGSGDGLFHILENTRPSGEESGRELFAFYPRELLGNIKLRKEGGRAAQGFPYGVDGSPVVLRVDINGDGSIDHLVGDVAIVYFGLRRGGSSYYALDVSDPSAAPKMRWKIAAGSAGPFAELGLSFSKPVVGKVNYSGVPTDVLIFAGGYHGGWNSQGTARIGKDLGAADDGVGNAVYVVNARSGELVWKAIRGVTGESSTLHYEHAGLVDSIPSEVSVMTGPDGVIHRLYVGDTGGAVWRIDLPPNQPASDNHRSNRWFVTKLADLGADEGEEKGAPQQDRRFFHAPDIVRSQDALGSFEGILIQSGDRAHPNEVLVENYLFYIKDRQTVSGGVAVLEENSSPRPKGRIQLSDLADQTGCESGGAGPLAQSTGCSEHPLEQGWKIQYEQAGEKGLSRPFTDAGRIFASTFVPGGSSLCPSEAGRGKMYVVRLENGSAVAQSKRYFDLGPGIPPGALLVEDLIYIPGRGADLQEGSGSGFEQPQKLIPSNAAKLYSLYWREPGIDPL